MTQTKKSLCLANPYRIDILLILIVAATCLGIGLFKPVLSIQHMILFQDAFSIWEGIRILYQDKQYFLTILVFFFSIIFPIVKLVLLFVIWVFPFKESDRDFILRWLEVLGKWSMLDVFVVALIIVAAKLAVFASAEPQFGIYVFAAAIFLSMITSFLIHRVNSGQHSSSR